MPNLVRNEERKLAATFYNNAAVGLLVSGGAVPLISIALQVPTFENYSPPVLAMLVLALFLCVMSLRYVGKRHLKGLEE